MERATRISALVSRATSDLLDRHVRATGVKKDHLVEMGKPTAALRGLLRD